MNNADKPANPVTWVNPESGDTRREYGLTKREYFAGLAMQAYISGNTGWTDGLNGGSVQVFDGDAAREAVSYADALLSELDKEKG